MKKHYLFFSFLMLASSIDAQCWKALGKSQDSTSRSIIIQEGGTLWEHSMSGFTQIGNGINNVKNINYNYNNIFAITEDSLLFGWGQNWNAQLGLGNTSPYSNPVLLNSEKWLDISFTYWAGPYTTYAVRSDGTLWAWGNNQLTPIQLGTATDWEKVFLPSWQPIVILKNNGSAWTYSGGVFSLLSGDNWNDVVNEWILYSYLSIKDDGTIWQDFSSQFVSGNNWVDVTSLDELYYAIKDDGTLWSWTTPNAPVLVNNSAFFTEICKWHLLDDNNNLYELNVSTGDVTLIGSTCSNSISEHSLQNKELVKITNLLGQETEFKPNTTLIYVYSDGSTEKKFVVE